MAKKEIENEDLNQISVGGRIPGKLTPKEINAKIRRLERKRRKENGVAAVGSFGDEANITFDFEQRLDPFNPPKPRQQED